MISLHLLTLLLTIFTATVTALPTTKNSRSKHDNCVSNNFNKPWVLRDIFIWQPFSTTTPTNATNATTSTQDFHPTQESHGSINFLFFDGNKDLQMVTMCNSKLINGVTPDLNGGYNACDNSTVAFKYTADRQIMVERAYVDPW